MVQYAITFKKNQSSPEDISITEALDSTADLKYEDGDIGNIWL